MTRCSLGADAERQATGGIVGDAVRRIGPSSWSGAAFSQEEEEEEEEEEGSM
ncbi:hypothetical protein ACHAW5_009639 [Stephanodiscus triporus]|uniref:Uncharacterized protein n=1 Tax=Stephanodiscus triporus TaxID=2934178 RepID=A0ABD3NA73_9STRA